MSLVDLSSCALVWQSFWWFLPYIMCFRRASCTRTMKKPLADVTDVLSFVLDGSSMMMTMVAGLKRWVFVIQSAVTDTVSELTSSVWLSEELLVSLWLTESSSIVPVVSSNAWSPSAMDEKKRACIAWFVKRMTLMIQFFLANQNLTARKQV